MVTGFGLGITASGHKFAGAAAARTDAVEVTANGDAQVSTAQSKFGGASLLLDGTGDYLSFTENISVTDFTVEAFVRISSNPSGNYPIFATDDFIFTIASASGGFYRLQFYDGSANVILANAFSTLSTWYHFAVVRSGSTLTAYVDGTSVGSNTWTNTVDSSTNYVGYSGGLGGATYYNGYIDELRISNSARYTSNFTPSSSEFTNDNNTLLLLHMNGPNVTVVNQAQKDTDENQFGNASLLLDGTNDRLELSGDYSQSGDFTVECWFYATSTSGTRCIFAIGNESAGRQFVNVQGSNLYTDEYGAGGVDINGTGNGVSANTWHHCALSRSGTTVSLYLDGTRVGSITSSDTIGNSNNIYIGTLSDGAVDFVGNIDEFRVSTNARYTGASYTVPTSGFTNDANTQVLLHMDGDDAGTGFTFEDDTISS